MKDVEFVVGEAVDDAFEQRNFHEVARRIDGESAVRECGRVFDVATLEDHQTVGHLIPGDELAQRFHCMTGAEISCSDDIGRRDRFGRCHVQRVRFVRVDDQLDHVPGDADFDVQQMIGRGERGGAGVGRHRALARRPAQPVAFHSLHVAREDGGPFPQHFLRLKIKYSKSIIM